MGFYFLAAAIVIRVWILLEGDTPMMAAVIAIFVLTMFVSFSYLWTTMFKSAVQVQCDPIITMSDFNLELTGASKFNGL